MTATQRAAAKAPQDHKRPAGEFEFEGAVYHVPPAEDWDIDVLENLEDGMIVKAVKGLLGDAEYAKFRKNHSKVSELKRFMEAAGAAAGSGN